jgi:transposase-like protein
MLQSQLGFLPEGAIIVGKRLAVVHQHGQVAFANASGPIYTCAEDDRLGLRLAQGMFSELNLAGATALARALGVDQSTVHRNRAAYREGGVQALSEERGPRGGYKLTEDKRAHAQELLDAGRSARAVAKAVGVSEGTVRYALRQGQLRRPSSLGATPEASDAGPSRSGSTPAQRSAEDAQGEGGVAVKRVEERVLACIGELEEAPVCFEAAESVPGAGVLLALPELLSQGLLEIADDVYGRLKSGFFGLHSVLLTLAFMALLRIKTPEQLKGHAPGEFGLLLGLDRAPEVKTLRRKLQELGARGQAHALAAAFARRWANAEPEALGYLYVDGHVRPYHGRKHTLPKTHVARRRLCMPATTDFWVNDARAEPLFFVTAPANDSLLSVLEHDLLPQVRALIGEQRRVSVLFDREGWSPKSFKRWAAAGFDVITYRKGRYEPWPEETFVEVEDSAQTPPVRYRLAEQETTLSKGFAMREVRRLCDSGHQTSVMTTRRDLPMVEVASRMFARWRQENFFRYMRHEYELDHLYTYAVEPAEIQRLVPNPERKVLGKELAALRRELEGLKKDYAQAALENPEQQRRTMRGFKIANAELGKQIRALETRCRETEAARKALPKKVPIGEVLAEEQIVELERERKTLTDLIKMVTYRTESSMLRLIEPLLKRQEDEGRAFLKALFQTPADLVPHENGQKLLVRFHSMAHPRFNKVLCGVCEALTRERHRYPGTRLCVVYEGPRLASQTNVCQEV